MQQEEQKKKLKKNRIMRRRKEKKKIASGEVGNKRRATRVEWDHEQKREEIKSEWKEGVLLLSIAPPEPISLSQSETNPV